MADKTHIQIGGLPFKADDEQAAQAVKAGGKVISPEAAQQAAQAQAELSYVDQNWGNAGKFGLGVASGLTLGLGPGLAAQAGIMDPNLIQAAQVGGAYTLGDVAGTLAPALLTGGEAVGARTAIGRALAATPAGAMTGLGTLSERLAAGLVGETSGLLGRLGKSALSQAARGATEGALINLGHTVGENLIQNKPLSAEALAAAGLDGALFGGLIGGTMGTVGALSGHAIDGVASFGKSVVGRGARANGVVAKSLGMSADAVETAGEGLGSTIKSYNEVLGKGGSRIGESDIKKLAATRKAKDLYGATRSEVIADLTKNAPTAVPDAERVIARLNAEIAAPMVGTPTEDAVLKAVSKAQERIQAIQPRGSIQEVNVPAPKPLELEAWMKENSIQGPQSYMNKELQKTIKEQLKTQYKAYLNETAAKGYSIPGMSYEGAPTTWQKWIQSRDLLAKELQGPMSDFERSIRKETLRIVDSEIGQAMQGVGKLPGLEGVAEKFAAASFGQRMAEELEGHLGKKSAQAILSSEPAVTARDLGTFAGMAAIGHPVAGMGWLAAKGIGRNLQRKMEPAIAQMAYDSSIGAKAQGATLDAKTKINSSVRNFFKNATKGPSKAVYTKDAGDKAEKSRGYDRKAYEDAAARTEQLLSSNHQDKVRRYAKELERNGYGEFALQLMAVNQRAVQYLQWNLPARQGAKGMTSLRKQPASAVPTLQEYKFLRIKKGATDPFSILDDMEKGNLSRDAVQAVKYIYPELHAEIVQSAAQQIYEMKAEGKFMPMDKIVSLGVALDAQVDSVLTPDFVNSVQMALATPPPSDQPPPQQGGGGAMAATDLMTVTQKTQSV